MHSIANLDYLYLEITKEKLMKLLVADKSTQMDENDHNDLAQLNGLRSSMNTIRRPPERPPPPKLKTIIENPSPRVSEKKSGIDTLFRDMKIRKRFHTLKENTKKFSKNVHNKMIKRIHRSQSVNGVNKTDASEIEVKMEYLKSPSTDVIYQSKQNKLEWTPSIDCKPTTPTITKAIMPIDDLIKDNESIFAEFSVTKLITEFFHTASDDVEIIDFDQIVDNCLTTFVNTCNQQIEDTLISINEHFAQALDLDSISLTSNRPDLYKVHCVPGWKQLRIIEDIKTQEKFLSLKNTSYKSWHLLNEKNFDLKKRWVCFPFLAMNTLENEVDIAEKNYFHKYLLKMIVLTSIRSIYQDENFPKNVDTNSILLVSSKCGIIMLFREQLNESDLFSLEFLECDGIESLPELCIKSKLDTQQLITNFFQRPEILTILISSTWPLDYLALMLVELLFDDNE